MLDALHKRDEIDECFTRKGDMPISRQAQRVEVWLVCSGVGGTRRISFLVHMRSALQQMHVPDASVFDFANR